MVRELIVVFFATLGYALVANVPRRLYLPAALGGVLGWGMYLLLRGRLDSTFYQLLLTSAAVAAYAELCAKCFRAPATIFLIPGLIPLVPGTYIYYMMLALVQEELAVMWENAKLTAEWAFGIATGIGLVAVAHQVSVKNRKKA